MSYLHADFDRLLRPFRPTLLKHARRFADMDTAEDLVQDSLLAGYSALPRRPDITDARALARFIVRILINRCKDYRRRARLAAVEQPWPQDNSLLDAWWSQLHYQSRRDELVDAELLHEARFRMRHTELTEMQRACMEARLRGEAQRVTARRLNLSQATVADHIEVAVERLRACPVEGMQTPDIDHYAWKVGDQVVIYHKPLSRGSWLASEQLRKRR